MSEIVVVSGSVGPRVVVGPLGRYVRFDEYRVINPQTGRAAITLPAPRPVYVNADKVISLMEDADDPQKTGVNITGSVPLQVWMPLRQVLALLVGEDDDGA